MFISGGCAATGPIVNTATVADTREASAPRAIDSATLEQLPVDRYCEVDMLDPHDSYVGRIVRVQANVVTLDNATHHQRTFNDSPLARSRFAWVRRLAKNTGVGMEALDREQSLHRHQIARVTILDPEREEAYRAQRADWIERKAALTEETTETTADVDRLTVQRGSSSAARR